MAVKAFDQVVKDYEPGHVELRRIIRERGDPMRYFREIIATGLDKLSAESLLPPVALDWAREDGDLDGAVRLFTELQRGEPAAGANCTSGKDAATPRRPRPRQCHSHDS